MDAAALTWNADGLVPAVVQDAATGAVLMLAYMNAEAWQRTQATGIAYFWSRSRQALWQKGETSGNTLRVVEIRIDCDRDAVLLRCTPAGPTCHTGTTSCFFHVVGADGITDDDQGVPAAAPVDVLRRLEATMGARQHSASAGRSYTKALLDGGMAAILAKVAEEHGELAAEFTDGPATKVVHETADLVFHVAVGLVARGIALDDVWRELARREGQSGHVEKARRTAT